MTHTTCPISILLALAMSGVCAQAQEQRSTLADQQDVAVTIYNDNLALVKDHRIVQLKSGSSALAFRDVSAMMRPETALMRSLNAPGSLTVLEQNYDYDLLTPQKLLEKYVGQSVNVVRTNTATGLETTEVATVLAANNGVVLKIGPRIETGIPGRLVFDAVPANLRDRPTLVMNLDNTGASKQDVELSYLTAGLGWKADYVVELNEKDDKLDISGWVTLSNRSGATYSNAKLQLMAGDVNVVPAQLARGVAYAAAPPREVTAKAAMKEESLFEYHMYTLGRRTTIAENQTKQVSLLTGTGVPVRKEFVLSGSDHYYRSSVGDELGQKIKVGVFVEFENKEAAHLGMPLPKGVIRVYKKDAAGNAQFVGEDGVEHTPKNEKVRLKLGDAFDVTAIKKQVDFKNRRTVPMVGISGRSFTEYESAYEVLLKNAKKEAVTVTVIEPMPGDWQVLAESHPHTKGASNTAVWNITVPPEGTSKLTYRSLVKF